MMLRTISDKCDATRFKLFSWIRIVGYLCRLRSKDDRDWLFLFAQRFARPFVLQVGANDGITKDPLYQILFHYHWHGLLLEPIPDVFTQLTMTYNDRPDVCLLNAAQGAHDGTTTMYRVRSCPEIPSWCQRIASFSKSTLMYHSYKVPLLAEYVEAIQVPVYTFDTLVKMYGITTIDVVVIDAEGYDYDIVKQLDLELFRPYLIIYERIHLSVDDQCRARRVLEMAGYTLHMAHDNIVAVRGRR